MSAPPEGWITVAAAAKALSESGDTIDASNVSRYLARFAEVPSLKFGKYRFVDLAALVAHRATNVLVGEKRAARDLPDDPRPPAAPRPIAPPIGDQAEDEDDAVAPGQPGSALNEANLQLKRLAIRDRELDLAAKEGTLVPDVDVILVVTGVVQAFVAELERQETAIAATLGRDTAAAFRKARKEAQMKAATRLLDLARKNLPEALAGKLTGSPAEG